MRILFLSVLLLIATSYLFLPSFGPKLLTEVLEQIGAKDVSIQNINFGYAEISIKNSSALWSNASGLSSRLNIPNLLIRPSLSSLGWKELIISKGATFDMISPTSGSLSLESTLTVRKLANDSTQINPAIFQLESTNIAPIQIHNTEVRTDSISIQPTGIDGKLKFKGNFKLLDSKDEYSNSFSGDTKFRLSHKGIPKVIAATISVPKFFSVLPISNFSTSLEISSSANSLVLDRLAFTGARFEILGGQIIAKPLNMILPAKDYSFDLDLVGINLKTLLQKYPAANIEGTGIVDGRLTLIMKAGKPFSARGNLITRAPGGEIRADLTAWAKAQAENVSINTVANALKNFHYSALQAEIQYTDAKTLRLQLNLKGSNPDFKQGQAVNLNVAIEEDLPALLETMRLLKSGY